MNTRVIAGVVASALALFPAAADQIFVPGDYPTIQEAIDPAGNGDEIIVAEGVYVENIDFLGKAITVRSTDPSDREVVDATIIDGAQAGTVVTLTAGIIRGFTIRNGFNDLAGGVYARNVAEIRDNVIIDNTAEFIGGGIHADGDVVIENNLITENTSSTGGWGGGVYALTRVIIHGNVIRSNTARIGAGILAQHNCLVRNNVIVGNHASYGGGVDARDNATIRSNLIAGNFASRGGGGVYALWDDHYGPITGNTFAGNISSDGGSAIQADKGVISSNIVAFSVSNRTAVMADSNAYVDYNCVFGNAGPPGRRGPNDIEADPEFVLGATGTWTADATFNPATFTTTLNDFDAFFAPDALFGGLVNPNTNQELRFAIVANTRNTITVMGDASQLAEAGDSYQVYDFHLSSNSPCISVADPTQPVEFYAGSDIDGEPRVQDCNPDIGADEVAGEANVVLNIVSTMTTPVIQVSLPDCNGEADGVGSFNRFYQPAPSVTLTAEPLEFVPFRWVIDGDEQPDGEYMVTIEMTDHIAAVAEYRPVVNVTQQTFFTRIQDAISSFSTRDGDEIVAAPSVYVEIIDFRGKNITLRSVDPSDAGIVASTVIDGNAEDTVVTLSAGTISGFTIRNGDQSSGGGVYASGVAVVSDNIIEDNHAWQWGAGVCAQDNAIIRDNVIRGNRDCQSGTGIAARGDVLITGNTITLNTSSNISDEGGGAYIRERVLFIENTVTENRSGAGGGVIAVDDSIVASNTIAGNVGLNRAGGVYARGDPLITNNLITGNESQDTENGGGGVNAAGSSLVTNNAIIGNTSFGPGGGVQIGFGADLLGNTIVANTSATQGGGVYAFGLHEQFVLLHNLVAFNSGEYGIFADEPIVNDYNCVYGNELGDYGGLAAPGSHAVRADPLLAGDDIHLLPGSPCIDAGDPAFSGDPDETDIDGEPRVQDGDGDGQAVVDIGADEFTLYPLGDLNCDGVLDAFDIEPFLLALFDPDEYQNQFSDCDINNADVNGDGAIDAFDIEPFLDLLFGP